MTGLLSKINGHADIKKLSKEELAELAQEIRQTIIETVSRNGGHLSPNLGVVELTIALHRVFDFSRDKIVWDVGHQCYTHKLLTGRQKVFDTLRREGGISGFPRREENPADYFNTGHAGTSISAALGFATARDLSGEKYDVVAFIGDGSMTSGLSFEGLNNAGSHKTDVIVILNDNEMSISSNVGALSKHLTRIISGDLYNRLVKDVSSILGRVPALGARMTSLAHLLEEAIITIVKGLFVPGRHFEDLGFRYFGPIDGHNIKEMEETLESVRKLEGPRLIHVVTKKGKGYVHAEEKSGPFHGISPFVISTGKKVAAQSVTYTEIFGKTMVEMGATDEKILCITAAMPDGTGLVDFAGAFPSRMFDVGIAEQHAVTFAGALAASGYKPVVAIYSTFMQRAFDQVVHDVCNMNLRVVFAIDRAGIVGDDGATHQGVFDISFLRSVPNLVIMAPKSGAELREMLRAAVAHGGPVCVRYPRGTVEETPGVVGGIKIGKGELLSDGTDILLCAIGNRVSAAVSAAKMLESAGFSSAVINARFAKPIDAGLIGEYAKKCGRILTIEENVLQGGFGSAVFEELRNAGLGTVPGASIGVPDQFVEHSSQDSARKKFGLDAEGIRDAALKLLREAPKLHESRKGAA